MSLPNRRPLTLLIDIKSDAERDKLRSLVAQAHERGRRLRFWATPEQESVWRELLAADVDLIGTDDLPRLAKFLQARQAKHPAQ